MTARSAATPWTPALAPGSTCPHCGAITAYDETRVVGGVRLHSWRDCDCKTRGKQMLGLWKSGPAWQPVALLPATCATSVAERHAPLLLAAPKIAGFLPSRRITTNKLHVNCISCGQGAPSLFMIIMAGEGLIKADVSITADTGWETDMLWSNGNRTTSAEFFERVTKPLATSYGIPAIFVRTRDENGQLYEPIPDATTRKQKLAGTPEFTSELYGIDIPLFGSQGGRLPQTCTSKWKIQGINQQLRRQGADTATCYLGLHLNEVRRVKPAQAGWFSHAWPLLDLTEREHGVSGMGVNRRWTREQVYQEMDNRGIPYLITTECDGCPHQDWLRWSRRTPETIERLTQWEAEIGKGNFFLTEERIPLPAALAEKKRKYDAKMVAPLLVGLDEIDPGCDSGGHCNVW